MLQLNQQNSSLVGAPPPSRLLRGWVQLSVRVVYRSFANPLVSAGVSAIVCISIALSGCAAGPDLAIRRATTLAAIGGRSMVEVKPVQNKPSILNRFVKQIPAPSQRTQLLLRKYDLHRRYEKSPDEVIEWLQELAKNRPTLEEIHGLAELAETQAAWSQQAGDRERASRLYAIAFIHAYQFLFDPKLDIARNAYDPQFRSICDVYNRSLEGMLREICRGHQLQPNKTIRIGERDQGIEFDVQIDGRWKNQEFERFELVNDYEASGIDNQYHTYGLGVPLIAIRKQQEVQSNFEKFYPPELTMPMTAFLHLMPSDETTPNGPLVAGKTPFRRATLTLYDPLESTQVRTEQSVVPLESDITTPLAYALRDPLLNRGVLATASLLYPDFAPEANGLFMLEPYDPNKIPVVMVHGLWSSPAVWVHMFNDLRANRDIHDNYQFWFYSYPTGQPFWMSAQQMRDDLKTVRRELDPNGDSAPLDQMILVGHSMGGLVSLLQTVESDDHFWNLVSHEAIESLDGDAATIQKLKETFYFAPNRSINRVITIATPFQGSEFANPAARWVGQKLITLPSIVTNDFQKLAQQNKGKLQTDLLLMNTSVDSLASKNPVFAAIEAALPSTTATFHNVMGRLEKRNFWQSSPESFTDSDGVVSIESASNEIAQSQVFVPAEHSVVHHHPGCILEVRRILLENLADSDRIRYREIPASLGVRQAALQMPFDPNSVSNGKLEVVAPVEVPTPTAVVPEYFAEPPPGTAAASESVSQDF